MRDTEWHDRWRGVKIETTRGGNIAISARSDGGNEELYRISGKSSIRKVQRHVRKAERWIERHNAKDRKAGATVGAVRRAL